MEQARKWLSHAPPKVFKRYADVEQVSGEFGGVG